VGSDDYRRRNGRPSDEEVRASFRRSRKRVDVSPARSHSRGHSRARGHSADLRSDVGVDVDAAIKALEISSTKEVTKINEAYAPRAHA